jgi:hypothetical protein
MTPEGIEARARCRDMRVRWLQAKGERIFYERLVGVFAVFALVMIILAGGIALSGNSKGADGIVALVTGLVSGAIGAFFLKLRSDAQGIENTLFAEYNAACPLPGQGGPGGVPPSAGEVARREIDAETST